MSIEVYVFGAARHGHLARVLGTLLLYLMGAITIALPPAPGWYNHGANEVIAGRMRTIGSTVVGQTVDTISVFIFTFVGVIPLKTIANMIVTSYVLKWDTKCSRFPIASLVISWLKGVVHSDAFDRDKHFNPFAFHENIADPPTRVHDDCRLVAELQDINGSANHFGEPFPPHKSSKRRIINSLQFLLCSLE